MLPPQPIVGIGLDLNCKEEHVKLYAAIDLHANNNYLAILDNQLKSVFCQRLPNKLRAVAEALEPFRDHLHGIAVESTFNWYWLVDGLMDIRYRLHLVNTSAVKQYQGLKYTDDRHDARWLARLMHLGILPEGYIYPKQERPLRDLLRRRSFLVRQRTASFLSVNNVYTRQTGETAPANELKRWEPAAMESKFEDPCIGLSISTSLRVAQTLKEQILRIEKLVLSKAKLRQPFQLLKAIGGIGDTLALTIMYETGEIERFPHVGDFSSYCRCVESKRLSNGKRKGSGNAKNGNPYLSWAFTEAANFSRRFQPAAKRWYDRKAARTNHVVATRALAHKLARASYYVLRDRVPFDPARPFG
jgi:transposase